MKNTIKNYRNYRKDRRIVKRELVRLAAPALLTVRKTIDDLKTDNQRIIDLVSYIAGLSPEEIRKLLVHSMAQTAPEADSGTEAKHTDNPGSKH